MAPSNNDVIVPKLYLKAMAWVFALLQTLIMAGILSAVSTIFGVSDQQIIAMSEQQKLREEIIRLNKNFEQLMPREVADLQHRDFERRINEVNRQLETVSVALGLKLKANEAK